MNKIYYLARAATLKSNSFFTPNDRTFEQMKYSGLLRLISNRNVGNSVSAYYYSLKKLDFQNGVIRDRITDYMLGMGKVFDAQILSRLRSMPDIRQMDSLGSEPAICLKKDSRSDDINLA